MKASSKKIAEKVSEDFSDDKISKVHSDSIQEKGHSCRDSMEVSRRRKKLTDDKNFDAPVNAPRFHCGNRKRSQKVAKDTKSQKIANRKRTLNVTAAKLGSLTQKVGVAKPIKEQLEPNSEQRQKPAIAGHSSEKLEPISKELEPISEQLEHMVVYLRAIETNDCDAYPRSNGEYVKLAWDFVCRARSFTGTDITRSFTGTDIAQRPRSETTAESKSPVTGTIMLAQLFDLDSRLSGMRRQFRAEERRLTTRLHELVREQSDANITSASDFCRAQMLMETQLTSSGDDEKDYDPLTGPE